MICLIGGCAARPADNRAAMLASAEKQASDFPDGRNEKLTSFAYLGVVHSEQGVIRVVYCTSVLTGMLAPRGEARIYFFNRANQLIGTLFYSTLGDPKFCEGPYLFFFGSQDDGVSEGNALDLKKGVKAAHFVYIPRVGSWLPDKPQEDN